MIYGVRRGPDNGGDLLYVEISPNGEAGEAQNFAATDADESSGRFAPDGRFVAYVSNESGRSEVYVRSFPDGAGKWQVSSNGGAFPRWRRDGSELYYVDGTTLMAVPVSPGQGFVAGTPQALFNTPLLASVVSPGTLYDVSADGQRFLPWASLQSLGEAPPIRVHVVENWYEEFRDRER
jgi:dipeptidyl aminopeptidase/acylaminoacyl peptidase